MAFLSSFSALTNPIASSEVTYEGALGKLIVKCKGAQYCRLSVQ